jgi:two-component system sensor histidine kinase HydH
MEPAYTLGKPYQFKRRFLCLSLLAIVVVTIASSILLSNFLCVRMLRQDAESMRAYVHSIVKVEQANDYFLGQRPVDGNIIEFFNHIGFMPDVARANVFAKDGRVLWSSSSQITGERFSSNPELEQALAGNLQIKSGVVGEHDKPEHVALGNSQLRFVEIYIPVMQEETGDIIGAIEVYRLPNALFATIAEGRRIVWISAALAGGILLATLFGIVRRADLVIRTQQERLIETQTMSALGEVASAVAHGIRNPLASIRSSAELWHDSNEPSVHESARDIMSEIDRLEKWVRELLTYSQPLEDQMATVALPPIIQESVTSFARESERRDISIKMQVSESLPPVAGDPALLIQAFNNLIANALDASQPGSEIVVRASNASDQKHVELVFIDNGVGIAPERMSRVGSTFYTTKHKGLGVGLALVRRIVKRSGGRVVIASRQGVGTTVTLFFQRSH